MRLQWDYDYDPTLSFFSQPKFLRGMFSIFLVSLMMTVFEIGFYRVIIDPETKKAVRGILDHMEDGFYTIFKNQSGDETWFSPATLAAGQRLNLLDSFLKTNAEREELLVDRINTYAYITASFMVFLLLTVLYYIHNRLTRIRRSRHMLAVFGDNYGAAIITSFLTVLMLASFQYLFYQFGLEFRFVGRNGMEELQNSFNNALRQNLGMDTVE